MSRIWRRRVRCCVRCMKQSPSLLPEELVVIEKCLNETPDFALELGWFQHARIRTEAQQPFGQVAEVLESEVELQAAVVVFDFGGLGRYGAPGTSGGFAREQDPDVIRVT